MKRKSAVQLTAMVARGEKITVLYAGHAFRARAKSSGGRQIRWSTQRENRGVYGAHGHVRRRDEGRTWAKGWDTDAALALRAVAALS